MSGINFIDIIYSLIIIYVIISIFVFFAVNSNIFLNRRFAKYDLKLNAELRFLEPDHIAYWVAKNGDSTKNAIVLHGFTRNSSVVEGRAMIYWNLGYNVYLVDNASHGQSKSILFPSGFQYSWVVKEIIHKENISDPVIHGVSMGAIAAAYIAQKYPKIPKFIVCEALPNNFDNLYNELLQYMKVPTFLFFWVDWLSRKTVWRMFRDKDADYILTDIKCPMFYIHGKNDQMFKYEDHYNKTIQELNGKDNFESWLVPNSRHSAMNENPDFESRVIDFIKKYE